MSVTVKIVCLAFILSLIGNIQSYEDILHRVKRTFPTGGSVKMSLGVGFPVIFGDNSNRSLNCGTNLQRQYVYPSTPSLTIYKSPFLTGASRKMRSEEKHEPDDTRQMFYSTLETIWDRRGKPGHECVLKAICEVSQSPLSHNGLFGEIIDMAFTPAEDFPSNHHYHDARAAGKMGVNCDKMYPKCENGMGFLDSVIYYP